VNIDLKISLRSALLISAVAFVTGCGGDKPDPRYVGKFYSVTSFVTLDYVEDGKYLATVQLHNDMGGRWYDAGVFDAEIVNEKFYVEVLGSKEEWTVSDNGLVIEFPNNGIRDALKIPDDWDVDKAGWYMPNAGAWKEAIGDPKSWKAKLKDNEGVDVGL